jgi:hypothetical protein
VSDIEAIAVWFSILLHAQKIFFELRTSEKGSAFCSSLVDLVCEAMNSFTGVLNFTSKQVKFCKVRKTGSLNNWNANFIFAFQKAKTSECEELKKNLLTKKIQ